MSAGPPSPRIFRFAAFEADLGAGELRKHGLRIRLPEQAFQVLATLLEHPTEVVTRAELRSRLWPDRTFVDFDHGLNKAVNRLRTALGDSAANPRFVETIARRGYRLLVTVTSDAGPGASAAPHRIRLVVLPFENVSTDAEQDFFSDGLTEEMITELGRLNPGQLGIIARTSAMQYKQGGKRIDQIGRELNVDYVLEGSVRLEERRARITVQLIHVDDQTHLWAQSYDRELADIFEVQREVAQKIADSLAFELLDRRARAGRAIPEAYEDYLHGRYFWNRGTDTDARLAIEYFERALHRDPRYALAYSGIANCYGRLIWFGATPPLDSGPRAKAAATRALEIDAHLGEGHASMALVHFWFEWNWLEAEREFRRATELRPNYADAHNWYAAYLNVMGRFQEAAAEQKLAEDLDPLSLTIAMNAADPHYFARRYEPAIESFKQVLEREPRYPPAHFNLGRAYAQNGMCAEAIAHFESAAQFSGNRQASAALAYAYGRAGRIAEARKILADLERLAKDRYMPSPQLALIHLGLGENEQALDLLEQGLEERSFWMIYLKADPVYDCLRAHPRFIRLLERLGFASSAAT